MAIPRIPTREEFFAGEDLIIQQTLASIEKIASADLYRASLPKIRTIAIKDNKLIYEIRYSKQVKRITLQRWLVTKLRYNPGSVSLLEVLTLYDNLLHLQELSSRDPNFCEKFGSSLEDLALILKKFRISEKDILGTCKKLSRELAVLEGFHYPERNLVSVGNHLKEKFRLIRKSGLGTETCRLPQKAYIGKGYTDKGTAKQPQIDGSPSWQEVACAQSSQLGGLLE